MKGIGGFYYVYSNEIIYECKAKGLFRKDKVKPLVGDDVEIAVLDKKNQVGNIVEIGKRKSCLERPAVANVDQAFVIFAVSDPTPNLNLLDRFILMMELQEIKTVICFNKCDIVSDDEITRLCSVYSKCNNKVLAISSKNHFAGKQNSTDMETVFQVLEGKTTVLAGPSGVGKSSVVNQLCPLAKMETGILSEKIRRGKHTTRHSELFCIGHNTFIMDTPGFSTLSIPVLEKEEIKQYFTEFHPFEGKCKYAGCVHIREPGCEVKKQVEKGYISQNRYQNYMQMYHEINEQKKY